MADRSPNRADLASEPMSRLWTYPPSHTMASAEWRVVVDNRATMIRTTPFHKRLSELNDQHLYTHWQGYLSALRYSHAPKHEYFAAQWRGHLRHLAALQVPGHPPGGRGVPLRRCRARAVSACRPGRAAYTLPTGDEQPLAWAAVTTV